MPWELGYFDGFKPGFVCILPLVQQYDSEFKGHEYLGLYPTIENLDEIPGRPNLGMKKVLDNRGDRYVNVVNIPLVEAAKGTYGGLVRTVKG